MKLESHRLIVYDANTMTHKAAVHEKLKPCPFCGSDKTEWKAHPFNCYLHMIVDQVESDNMRHLKEECEDAWDVRQEETRIRNETLEELATMFDSEADGLEAVWKEYLASGNNGNATSYHTIPLNYAKKIRALKDT